MKVLAIIVAKMVILLGKILKRGSSMPGKIALKIDRNLLKKLKIKSKIVAVTGSSGKGSTSSMLAHVYSKMGYKVVHNASGANLKAGITTMLLEHSSISGKINGDIIIYEVDERFAKFIFFDVFRIYKFLSDFFLTSTLYCPYDLFWSVDFFPSDYIFWIRLFISN